MSDHEGELILDQERCLDALAIAIPICCKNKSVEYEALKALKLACKLLKGVVDGLLTRLTVNTVYTRIDGDFERALPDFDILTQNVALLRNIQRIYIGLDEDYSSDEDAMHGIRRILNLTAHNLCSLTIVYLPPTALLKDTNWPKLESLTLMGPGNIAGVKKELFSMRKLRSFHYRYDKSNKSDRKALLSAPFLYNLTELNLSFHSNLLTDLYMSKLFTRTINLETLELMGYLGGDYFGGQQIEKLKNLTLNGLTFGINLNALLSYPRPTLEHLSLQYGYLTTEQLENLILSSKTALENLQSLSLIPSPFRVGEGIGDELDWSCLCRIDFPNLTELKFGYSFKDAVGIVQPTANLPKLKSLIFGIHAKAHPNDRAAYAEEMFSSPVLQQLTRLTLITQNFRIASLAALCKYAPEMKNLEHLSVHSRDLEGVQMIANAGKGGGFPKLKRISFMYMDYDIRFLGDAICIYANGKPIEPEMGNQLKQVWPNIKYSYSPTRNEKYGQPDEFDDEDDE